MIEGFFIYMKELIKYDREAKFNSVYITQQINEFRKLDNNMSELRHYDLLRKLELEFVEEIDKRIISLTYYLDASNRKSKCYELTFDESLQLLMTESRIVRKGVIKVLKDQKDLITAYEENNAPKLPQTFSEALQLAADQAKQLELQAPKVESFDTFIDSKSLQGFKEVANLLGLGRNKLMAQLREKKILTKRNIPYQEYLGRGYFEVKESTQSGFNVATTYVTAKGIDYIRKMILKN